jgi:hypothetical protein
VRLLGLFVALVAAPLACTQVSRCRCDPADPESLQARECSLTREAVAQPATPPVFFLRDINPAKPNRWLALPRAVRKDMTSLAAMTPDERLQLWTEAIRKARELWGDQWGLAMNGDEVRTQCQPHVHIGKLRDDVEGDANAILVDGPEKIPVPRDGGGLWVHPRNGKLHVHLGMQLAEPVLLR